MSHVFVPAVDPPEERSEKALWFAFRAGKLLVVGIGQVEDGQQNGRLSVPLLHDLHEVGVAPVRTQYLGTLAGMHCYSAELEAGAMPPGGMGFHSLRGLHGRLDDAEYALAGRASQIVEWDRTHLFCGHCGTPTEQMRSERARKCSNCGLVSYPRISPAVIVLVSRGDEMLLARGNNFPAAFYSALAGFVEPGESLEETVVREVREEVGVELRNIRYFGSQPWPFPHSLMIGFTAEYAGGEIVVEAAELADARWFSRDDLPNLPPPLSIARRLIDSFLAAH